MLMGYNGKTCLCLYVCVCVWEPDKRITNNYISFYIFCLLFNKLFLFLVVLLYCIWLSLKFVNFCWQWSRKKQEPELWSKSLVILFRERRNFKTKLKWNFQEFWYFNGVHVDWREFQKQFFKMFASRQHSTTLDSTTASLQFLNNYIIWKFNTKIQLLLQVLYLIQHNFFHIKY